jgi:uncharacterized protein (DUF4415 family)
VQDTGKKELKFMNKGTVEYTKAPPTIASALARSVPLSKEEDAELFAEPENKSRITIHLDKDSIDFFKSEALLKHGHYQTMINSVLRHYVARRRSKALPAK